MTGYDDAVSYDAEIPYNGALTPPVTPSGSAGLIFAPSRQLEELLREDEEILIL